MHGFHWFFHVENLENPPIPPADLGRLARGQFRGTLQLGGHRRAAVDGEELRIRWGVDSRSR